MATPTDQMSSRRKNRLVPRGDAEDFAVISEQKHTEDAASSKKRRRVLSASDNDSSFLENNLTDSDIFTPCSQMKAGRNMFSTAKFYGENVFKRENLTSDSEYCCLENKPTARYPKRHRKPVKVEEDSDDCWTPDKEKSNGKTYTKKPPVKIANNVKEEPQFEAEESEVELSEFQLMRQKNIEERMRLFKELKLNEARDDLEEVAKKAPVKFRPSKISSRQPTEPLRKSKRVEGIKAEEPTREARAVARSATSSFPTHSIWGHRQRSNAAVLPMCKSVMKNFSQDDCRRIMSSFLQDDKPSVSEQETSSLKDFKSTVDKLTLKEQHKMKVVPSRIYSLAFHPSSYLIAAGCKSGAVGLWKADLDCREWDDSQVIAFDYHSAPTNCVSFSESQPHVLYTTSYDGTLRRGDLNRLEFSLVHATQEDERANHLAWHCELDAHTLLVGRGDGNLARLDLRQSLAKAQLFR